MRDLKGRTAFITGGASGIGLGLARVFGREGMKIAIADVDRPALETARRRLEEEGSEVLSLVLDVTDRQAMEDAAGALKKAWAASTWCATTPVWACVVLATRRPMTTGTG